MLSDWVLQPQPVFPAGEKIMRHVVIISVLALGLAACGNTRQERATSGALIGAGTGAAVTGIATGSAGAAVAGGIAGGVGGAIIGGNS